MNQNGTRKGERTKKPPKYMQYDQDADYGNLAPIKTADQKEKVNNAAEMNQIAKLFQKFLTNINQKCRDYLQGENNDKSSNDNENGFQLQAKKGSVIQNVDQNAMKSFGMPNGGGKKVRDNDRLGAQQRTTKTEVKKTGQNSRSQPNINPNIQADLDYHTMINEHIRNAYPNINSISPDMLKTLDIPKQLFDHSNGLSKGKKKDGKNNPILKNNGVGKDSKEELKPFKRQSYHVAIAYHIHIKRLKNNAAQKDLDPTYAARKLRENQGQGKEK